MDLSLTYRALAEKTGRLDRRQLDRRVDLPLWTWRNWTDDRKYFPPYDAVPVVRQSTLAKYPELREVLKQLGGILTVDEMRKLNYAVDGEKRQARDVAREFLIAKGFAFWGFFSAVACRHFYCSTASLRSNRSSPLAPFNPSLPLKTWKTILTT